EGSCTRDWEGFGDPEEGSLLMLGQVKLTTFSSDFTRTFFEEGLGAPSCDPVQVGTTQLRFQSADEKPASTWPGQLYIWVENIQDTWKKSRELSQRSGTEIVESVVCCHDERYCDALVLRDPGSANVLVVNQAPKGYAKALRDALGSQKSSAPSSLVCLMDLLCRVPVGTSVKLAAFYERFLSAKVMQGKDGYRLRFASGDVLRQTFTFQDDESATEAWLPAQFPSEVCFYLESDAKFRIAFAKFSNAKLATGDWSEAERAREFRISHCIDESGSVILDLPHLIRAPGSECPYMADQAAPDTAMGG
ncbi:GIP, partial [Symbiodinium sp. CCMP2456]